MMISRKFLYGRLIMQVVPCGSTWLGIQLTKLAFNFDAAAKVARLRLQAPLRSTPKRQLLPCAPHTRFELRSYTG